MTLPELVGYLAGLLSTGAFLPQAIKTLRTRSADDLSLVMLLVALTGNSLWAVYGILMFLWPVIIPSSVTALLLGVILAAKLRYDARRR